MAAVKVDEEVVMTEKGKGVGAEEGTSGQAYSRERGMKFQSSASKPRKTPVLRAQHLQI